jgi:hypothetical protein
MSSINRVQECISDLVFDEWLSGELDHALKPGLEAHLSGCERCSQRRDQLLDQRDAFLERLPSWDSLAARRGGQKAREWNLSWQRPGPWAVLACAACIALAFVIPRALPSAGVRTKGGPRIGFYVKRGEQVVRGMSGEKVHKGEQLRFTYSSDAATHLGLIYHDASAATTYYPLDAHAAAVKPGRDVALDFAVELDAELGVERVVALFCDDPIALEPVRAALQATGRLPELAGCSVDVVVLDKQSTP